MDDKIDIENVHAASAKIKEATGHILMEYGAATFLSAMTNCLAALLHVVFSKNPIALEMATEAACRVIKTQVDGFVMNEEKAKKDE